MGEPPGSGLETVVQDCQKVIILFPLFFIKCVVEYYADMCNLSI
jgi:hypothetical protein